MQVGRCDGEFGWRRDRIEDKSKNVFSLDAGLADTPRVIEWLDNILSSNISPRVRDISITCEQHSASNYVVVDVPRSTLAPHQAPDKKFYKRSNNRSFPMEAYEIDDIRQRRLSMPVPLIVELEIRPSGSARLVVANRSDWVCRNVQIEVKSNFHMAAFDKKDVGSIRLGRIGIGQRVEYYLNTTFGILAGAKDAALELNGSYQSEVREAAFHIAEVISIAELVGSTLPSDDYLSGLDRISKEVHGIKRELESFRREAGEVGETLKGAGLRISPMTLQQMKEPSDPEAFVNFKYSGRSLTVEGLAELLGATVSEVLQLYDAFQTGYADNIEEILDALPPEAANRARKILDLAAIQKF